MGLPPRIESQLAKLFNAALDEKVAALPQNVRDTDCFRAAIYELHHDHYDLLKVIEAGRPDVVMASIRNHKGTAADRYDHLCFIAYTSGFPPPPMTCNTRADSNYIKEIERITKR